MAVTTLPTAPQRTQTPAVFAANADAFVAALSQFVTDVNALQADVTTKQTTASTAATNASTSATAASTSATNASTSATAASTSATNASTSATAAATSATQAASYAAGLSGTSTTSLVVGTGSKTFTTQSGKQFTVGGFAFAASNATPANYMFGQITAYSSTTLTINVIATGGSGTVNDWNITVAGAQGPAGTGITNQTTGFTATGGTTAKTLTVDANFTTSAAALLTSNTFAGNQNYADYQNSRAMLIDCGYVFLDKGNSGTTTQTIDYTAGSNQKITATGNHTIAFSNWPPSGNLGVILLEAVNFGAFTVTWPTINWVLPSGATTTSVSTWLAAINGRTAFQSSGTEFLRFITRDGGTTIYGGFAL